MVSNSRVVAVPDHPRPPWAHPWINEEGMVTEREKAGKSGHSMSAPFGGRYNRVSGCRKVIQKLKRTTKCNT